VRTLRTLKELTVAETVKAGPSSYGRLEIKDPIGDKDDEVGTKVELKSADGSELASMVLGMNYAGGRTGNETPRYLRVPADESQVFVVPKTFYDLQADPSDWLVRDFFRVQKPKNVTVTHPEGEVYKFTRETEGGDLQFEGLAENEELNTANTGTIGAPFSSASFKDVAVGDDAKPEQSGLDKPVKVEIDTFDGLKYLVSVGKGKGDNVDSDAANATVTTASYFLTVEVSADLPKERVAEADETVADDASDEDKKKAEDLKNQRDAKFAADQETLKEKLEKEKGFAGIVYEVDSWAVEKFFKKRDELVKEKEAEDAAVTPAGAGVSAPPIGVLPAGGDKPRVVATTPPISVADVLQKAQEDAAAAAEGVKDVVDDAADTVDAAKETGDDAVDAVKDATDAAKEAADEAAEELQDAAEGAGDAAKDTVEEAATDDAAGAIDGVTEAADEPADAADGEQ
jgi:hypothetical protein